MGMFRIVDIAGRSEKSLDLRRCNSWVGSAARWVGVLAIFLVMLGVGYVPAAGADVLTVCGSGCDYTTIEAALQAASAGDTVSILDATHTESGIVVDRNITIAGGNAGGTTVQAAADINSATDRVFRIPSGVQVVIRDMTIRHGKATGKPARGGGIWNGGTLTLEQVTVKANQAIGSPDGLGGMAEGGGVYNEGTLSVTGCTLTGNLARGGNSSDYTGNGTGGGLFHAGGSATVANTTISGNTAEPGSGSG